MERRRCTLRHPAVLSCCLSLESASGCHHNSSPNRKGFRWAGIFAAYKTVTDNDSTLFIFRTMAYEQPRPRAQTARKKREKGRHSRPVSDDSRWTLASNRRTRCKVWTCKRYWCSLSFPYWRCLSPFVSPLCWCLTSQNLAFSPGEMSRTESGLALLHARHVIPITTAISDIKKTLGTSQEVAGFNN
jgi:hypothetical protein